MKIEELERLEKRLEYAKESVENIEKEIEIVKGLEDLTIQKLYSLLSEVDEEKNYNIDGLVLEVINTQYEHILGGDGRSAAWSEMRGGKIVEVSGKYLLFEHHIEIIRELLNRLFWNYDIVRKKENNG